MKYTNGQASMEKQATVKQVKQVKQRILEITIDNFLWHSSHFLAQTTPIHHHLKIKDVDVKPSIPIPSIFKGGNYSEEERVLWKI